ncbi:hypothetical protein D3C83_70820 [compost metagenome]
MGERLARQLRVAEGVSEPALEVGEALGRLPAARRPAGHLAVVAVKSTQALMLCTSGTRTDQLAVTTAEPPSLVISRSSERSDFTSSMALRRS